MCGVRDVVSESDEVRNCSGLRMMMWMLFCRWY